MDYQPKTPEQEVARAGEARRLLDSPLFIEMRVRVESTMAAQRRAVPVRDTDMHTRLILMEQLWGNVIDFFEQTAQTGQMAQLQIQQQRSIAERMKQQFANGVREFRRFV